MNNQDVRATLESMSKADLVELALNLGIDGTFKLINRNFALLFYTEIESGKTMLMIDLANMHGINHKYSMSTVDQFINNVLDQFRSSDFWIRWGSDEIIVILNSGDAVDFISRLDAVMAENELYAVYGIVTTSNNLVESINRADSIVMAEKCRLERCGLKPDRNQEYCRLASSIVCE
jgi:GGDEF domain-containing protein